MTRISPGVHSEVLALRRIYEGAASLINYPDSLGGRSLARLLIGEMWEFFALDYVSRSLHNSLPTRRMLSGDDVISYYQQFLFPDSEIVNNPFGQKGLAGISIPDALIVDYTDATNILVILEATSHPSYKYVHQKRRAYRKQREELVLRYGEKSISQKKLRFLVPIGGPGFYVGGADIVILPIEYTHLYDFTEEFYNVLQYFGPPLLQIANYEELFKRRR